MSLLDAALAADSAGLCVLPPREDGSKAPDAKSWTQYQQRRSTEQEIRAWYAGGRGGLGVVCGNVSGGLEMLELEGRAVADGIDRHFRELAESAGLGDVLTRILAGYSELTPSGGYHLFYRATTPLGNTPLARRPATADELAIDPANRLRVLIETRGEGGYVVTAPSNGRVHPSGGAWTLKSGGFGSIATISDEERDELWRIARALDRMPVEPARQPASVSGDDRPGDRYNARPDVQAEIVALLEQHGWTRVYSHGERDYMRRPGKRIGISATVGFAGPGVLHVFSSSVAEFEALRSYSPFGVYALLEHGGDYGAAAAELAAAEKIVGSSPGAPVVLAGDSVPAILGIGSRTALDLRHGTPPAQLVDPFLTPEGATVMYARGGTGKGLTACWLAMCLVRAGRVPMVVDFEGHEREWGSRLRGLGTEDDELSRVHYRAPFGVDWTAATGPLSKVAGMIREDAERLGVSYLIVDSYSVAVSNGDTMGGEAAAREYFGALATIGLPSLTIAHVRGDSGKFPERPFGSVFVHNLARETWALERIDGSDGVPDPDEARFGPYVVSLELRNKKANARPTSPAQFVAFSFFDDGSIEATTNKPAERSVADLAADALADGPMTLPKIVAAIEEDTGQKVSGDTLKRAMLRHSTRFAHESTGARPRPWSLR